MDVKELIGHLKLLSDDAFVGFRIEHNDVEMTGPIEEIKFSVKENRVDLICSDVKKDAKF